MRAKYCKSKNTYTVKSCNKCNCPDYWEQGIGSLTTTRLSDETISQAISDCLAIDPINGLCELPLYGSMPDWDVSRVTVLPSFSEYVSYSELSSFNPDISKWNVSRVVSMANLFYEMSGFNQPLNSWNVSNVTNMYRMFFDAPSFNQPLNNWNVGRLVNMESMFSDASSFNQPLSNWNTKNVQNMKGVFYSASSFNQNINNWNTKNVQNMRDLFRQTPFNQPLNNWNVENVTAMNSMFEDASSFDQPLHDWIISNVGSMGNMLDNSALSTANYDLILSSWSDLPIQQSVRFGAVGINYTAGGEAEEGRNILDSNGWAINDEGGV